MNLISDKLFHFVSNYVFSIVSLVFLIEKQYVFEEWQAFWFVSNYLLSQSIHLYSRLSHNISLRSVKLFHSVSNYIFFQMFTCIPDSATIFIWRVTRFFTSSPTINYLNRLTCINDSFTLLVWTMTRFSLRLQLLIILIVSLVFLIQPQY